MASIKTSISVSTAGAKKPADGAAAGTSASQVAPNVSMPKPPTAPKAASTAVKPPKMPAAPSAPKTPIAKEQMKENTLDYSKMKTDQKPVENTLDYSKINEIKQQKPGPALDYASINAKQPQSEPHVLDYKAMQANKPWTGAAGKKQIVDTKLDKESKMNAIDALKAKRMFRARYLREKIAKEEVAPTPSQPPLSGAGSQSNVSKFNAGMNKEPGIMDTVAGIFKTENQEMGGKMPKTFRGTIGKKTQSISKSERDFIKEDLVRPYTPYFNDVEVLIKKEFKPLEAEVVLSVLGTKTEELSKSDPLDKYKIDKGGSLKFGTSVPTVGFPRNTLESKENKKAGSDEGSGGEISKTDAKLTEEKDAQITPRGSKMTTQGKPAYPVRQWPDAKTANAHTDNSKKVGKELTEAKDMQKFSQDPTKPVQSGSGGKPPVAPKAPAAAAPSDPNKGAFKNMVNKTLTSGIGSKYKMTKAEISEDLKKDWEPKFKKASTEQIKGINDKMKEIKDTPQKATLDIHRQFGQHDDQKQKK